MKTSAAGAFALIFLFAPALFGPCLGSTSTSAEETLTRVVVSYIDRTRHWPRSEYSVEFNRREGGMLFYWVIYRKSPQHTSFVVGNDGKSFVAVVDPIKQQVARELAFQ